MKPHQREGLERKSFSPKHREKDQEKVEINWGGLRWSGFLQRAESVPKTEEEAHGWGPPDFLFMAKR